MGGDDRASRSAERATPGSRHLSANGDAAIPDSVPLAPMGRSLTKTDFSGRPDYQPPDDPEVEAAVTGKRTVGPVDLELSGGIATPEDLAREILRARLVLSTVEQRGRRPPGAGTLRRPES